jgi:hypothetical protein
MVYLSTEIDVFRRSDQHLRSGDDVAHGWVLGVLVRDPGGDGDVVGVSAEGDGDGAVQAEEDDGLACVVG